LTHTVDELAKFIVPEGAKYKIIEDSDIPNDRSFRDAWEIDESELSDVSHDFYSYMCHEYSKTYPISSHPELYDDREVKEFTKQLKELNKQYPYSSNPEVYKDVNKQYLSKL